MLEFFQLGGGVQLGGGFSGRISVSWLREGGLIDIIFVYFSF